MVGSNGWVGERHCNLMRNCTGGEKPRLKRLKSEVIKCRTRSRVSPRYLTSEHSGPVRT